MKRIVLISCASKKRPYEAKASEIYVSTLFKLNLQYATKLKPDAIFVLSAKYGLLRLDDEIEPYDATLNRMAISERKAWASRVVEQLRSHTNLQHDHFIFLAGEKYREYLIPHLTFYEIPMQGLPIGKQLQYLNKKVTMSEECLGLHRLFNSLPRFRFPFDTTAIPKNGIYILFEQGEHAHGGDRIVRVGTHTGENQLHSRLRQHFLKENKDRSIFRKNIGRAILNRDNDPFLERWNWDLTPRRAKEKYGALIDANKIKGIEKEVSNYIQSRFSFTVFEVATKPQRMQLESKIISTISLCGECRPSNNWMGLCSPKEKINKSGLWLVNELYKEPFSMIEFGCFKNSVLDKSRDQS